jgi:hypothetical protein
LDLAALIAQKKEMENRISQASGPHIPPDRDAEHLLEKIEAELNKRGVGNGPSQAKVPSKLPPAGPADKAPLMQKPADTRSPRRQALDREIDELSGKIIFLERKQAWLEDQNQFSTDPDPDLAEVKQQIDALLPRLKGLVEKRKNEP